MNYSAARFIPCSAKGFMASTSTLRATILSPVLLSVLFLLLAAGVHAQTPPHRIRIAAAADLQPVLPAVLQAFEQQTRIHAEATYQSSATLTQQIFNGSPFDLFLAADMSFPQRLIDAGLATEARPVPYARGTLVLWARNGAAFLHGLPLSIPMLRNPALQSVAIANPQTAPYGRAAQAAMQSLFLTSTLMPKLRIAANIAQAAQFVDSGNAEAGFLSLTSASTPQLKADGAYVLVPLSTYPPIIQSGVVLRGSTHQADADRLLQFLATPETRALLLKGGLMPPE